MTNDKKAPVMGTCPFCENRVRWPMSVLESHMPDGSFPKSMKDHENKCPGSHKRPVEAFAPERPMTDEERDLSRRIFGS